MKKLIFTIAILLVGISTHAQSVYVPGVYIPGRYVNGTYIRGTYVSGYYVGGGEKLLQSDFYSIGYTGNAITPVGINFSTGRIGWSLRGSLGTNKNAPKGEMYYNESFLTPDKFIFTGNKVKGWDLTTNFDIPLNYKIYADTNINNKTFKWAFNFGIGAGFVYSYKQYESIDGKEYEHLYGTVPSVVYVDDKSLNPIGLNLSLGINTIIKDEIKIGIEYNTCYKNITFNLSKVILSDKFMKDNKIKKYKTNK